MKTLIDEIMLLKLFFKFLFAFDCFVVNNSRKSWFDDISNLVILFPVHIAKQAFDIFFTFLLFLDFFFDLFRKGLFDWSRFINHLFRFWFFFYAEILVKIL